MRPREARLLIQDIQICIADIEELTEGFDVKRYAGAKAVRLAVERQFITIGEAMYRLKSVSPEAKIGIESAVKISGFRNFLVHEYESIDNKEVWKVIQESLPILDQQINDWADELGMEPPPGQTR